MGAPMIRHLLAAGHRVSVWNRSRDKAEALVKDGAQVAGTPRELAERVDTVFVCVLDGRAVGDVVFGEHGLLAGDAPRVACNASSIIRASRPPRRAITRRARPHSALAGSMRPYRAACPARRPARSR
ncbi:2-hydroxy-3-oxopropionate reductase [Burkholderia cepacia]|nr:2-hydroxy-3-oxopropionate reductase [Burkholderia cepacia]